MSFWENHDPHHFHGFRIFERVHDSQKQYYLYLETPGHLKEFKKKKKIIFEEIFFLEIWKSWKSKHLNMLEKTGADKSWRSVLTFLETNEHDIIENENKVQMFELP